MQLSDVEVRILGCLMEKEATTPDNYPLSLNALTNACNQLSNREPVMSLGEDAVKWAVNSLRQQSLVRAIQHRGASRPTLCRGEWAAVRRHVPVHSRVNARRWRSVARGGRHVSQVGD